AGARLGRERSLHARADGRGNRSFAARVRRLVRRTAEGLSSTVRRTSGTARAPRADNARARRRKAPRIVPLRGRNDRRPCPAAPDANRDRRRGAPLDTLRAPRALPLPALCARLPRMLLDRGAA